jgi:hypothetical protein
VAYVDENYVRDYLARHILLPGVTFEAAEADDESVDAEVRVMRDGVYTNLSVQCGGGYLGLNEYGYSRPGDPSSFWMRNLGLGGVQPRDLSRMAERITEYLRRVERG